MSYEEVSQWNGKEIKKMNWYLLGVVSQPLRDGSPAQNPIFNHAIECRCGLLEFYMYARYKSHGDAIFSSMQDSSNHFHTFQAVFSPRLVGRKSKAKPNTLTAELVRKQKVTRKQMLKHGHYPRSGTK
jgi:hypothetical protein